MSDQYRQAGVDLEAGYESVRRIKKHIEKTNVPGVMANIGSFGGLFDLASRHYQDPVLVSGTDGVGTKIKIAMELKKYDTVGQDVVAMCVNDVLAQGAAPLFFLDYIAVGKNHPQMIEDLVKGVCDGCVLANCALIGGETAEMPDMYGEEEFDLAGFTVGCAERSQLIDPSLVQTGDVVLGLTSSGVHSNGFSLVRKILMKDHAVDLNQKVEGLTASLGETLLTPTKIYVKPVQAVLEQVKVHGIAHITGGGFHENMPRCLPEGKGLSLQRSAYEVPRIFQVLEEIGQVSHEEMYHVFNMGIGMILVVAKEDVDKTLKILQTQKEEAVVLGEVIDGEGVTFRD